MTVNSGNGILIPTYALLDSGSQSAFMREGFARQLNLKGKGITVNIGSVKNKGEAVKENQYSITVNDKHQNLLI